MMRRAFTAAAAVTILLAATAAAATPPPPSLTISKATFDRTTHTVDVRLRVCFSPGPRARVEVREQRALRGALEATRKWSPRGVEPDRIGPFACRANWRMNWLLKLGLRGGGTYTARIRVRDAYGRWTPPVTFGISSP